MCFDLILYLLQNMPRPRGADAAGLLLRELELQPPSEEWHRRNMFGGPWSEPDDLGPLDNMPHLKIGGNPHLSDIDEDGNTNLGIQSLWPRKRRLSERDAAFGLKTSMGLGAYLGVMGSRRDVITAVWRTGLDGEWYKVSMRCFASSVISVSSRLHVPNSDMAALSFPVHTVFAANLCICTAWWPKPVK
jgi:hypothetical protein